MAQFIEMLHTIPSKLKTTISYIKTESEQDIITRYLDEALRDPEAKAKFLPLIYEVIKPENKYIKNETIIFIAVLNGIMQYLSSFKQDITNHKKLLRLLFNYPEIINKIQNKVFFIDWLDTVITEYHQQPWLLHYKNKLVQLVESLIQQNLNNPVDTKNINIKSLCNHPKYKIIIIYLYLTDSDQSNNKAITILDTIIIHPNIYFKLALFTKFDYLWRRYNQWSKEKLLPLLANEHNLNNIYWDVFFFCTDQIREDLYSELQSDFLARSRQYLTTEDNELSQKYFQFLAILYMEFNRVYQFKVIKDILITATVAYLNIFLQKIIDIIITYDYKKDKTKHLLFKKYLRTIVTNKKLIDSRKSNINILVNSAIQIILLFPNMETNFNFLFVSTNKEMQHINIDRLYNYLSESFSCKYYDPSNQLLAFINKITKFIEKDNGPKSLNGNFRSLNDIHKLLQDNIENLDTYKEYQDFKQIIQ